MIAISLILCLLVILYFINRGPYIRGPIQDAYTPDEESIKRKPYDEERKAGYNAMHSPSVNAPWVQQKVGDARDDSERCADIS